MFTSQNICALMQRSIWILSQEHNTYHCVINPLLNSQRQRMHDSSSSSEVPSSLFFDKNSRYRCLARLVLMFASSSFCSALTAWIATWSPDSQVTSATESDISCNWRKYLSPTRSLPADALVDARNTYRILSLNALRKRARSASSLSMRAPVLVLCFMSEPFTSSQVTCLEHWSVDEGLVPHPWQLSFQDRCHSVSGPR